MMRRLRRRPFATRSRVAGFTLLEVLLTAILSATLLAGLWTLFGTYLRLFESGQARVERSQLIRALTRQISDDLHGVVITGSGAVKGSANARSAIGDVAGVPATPAESTASSFAPNDALNEERDNVPKFSLVGTQHMLRLDVLQSSTPLDFVEAPKSSLNAPRKLEPKAIGLKTILYSFEPPREVAESDREPPPGFVRREKTWEQMSADASTTGAASNSSLTAQESAMSRGFAVLTPADVQDAAQFDDAVIWTPEVDAFRFRYFDGREWLNEWDSREQGKFPVAVQVAMRLEPIEAPGHAKREVRATVSDESSIEPQGTALNDETNGEISDELLDPESSKSGSTEAEEGREPIICELVLLQAPSGADKGTQAPAASRLSFMNSEKESP